MHRAPPPQAPATSAAPPPRAAPRLQLLDALVPVATLGTLAVNGLANRLRLGGETTGSVSAQHPTLVTPAGYAFSIWGLIYVGLLVFSCYALSPGARRLPAWPRLRGAYLASCLLNGLWIVVWHHRLTTLSAGVIAALLASLLVIYRSLDPSRGTAPPRERWLVLVPFSLYAAWVTVATIVNVAVALTALGAPHAGPVAQVCAVVAIAGAGALAVVVALPRRDVTWLAVSAWALAAIAAARGEELLLRGLAAATAGILALFALGLLLGPRGPRRARD